MKKQNFINSIGLLSILYLFIFGISLHAFGNLESLTSKQKVEQNLLKLSLKEREYLGNFFKVQFFLNGFGYTIYGTKPMSFNIIANSRSNEKSIGEIDYMAIEHIFSRYRLKEGLEVWQQYTHLFPLRGFSFFSYPSDMLENALEVVLINHKNFIRVVEENLSDFQQVLGVDLSPEEILQECLSLETTMFNQIRHHDGLFGSLLGYGRNNSWEYKKRGGGYSLGSFTRVDPRDTDHILPPSFAVLPGTMETMGLQINYEKERLFINTIYQKEDFLSRVLMALCRY